MVLIRRTRKTASSCYSVRTLESELDRVGEVDGLPSSGLEYLLPTAKTVGDDQVFSACITYRRQKHSFTHGLCNRELIPFETKGAGHSAAPGIDGLQIRAHFMKQRILVAQSHDCLVMAMSMQEHFAEKLRRPV